MSGNALGGWLLVTLAAWGAAHLALVIGLARRATWWRALVALVVPPLAPAWGISASRRSRGGAAMHRRAAAWLAALVAYAVGVALGR